MMVILSSKVCSYGHGRCSGNVQEMSLYNDNGYVAIVDGSVNKTSYHYYLYQITLKPGKVAWYDPNAQKFICWNKRFTRLIAKKKPKLHNCMVSEVTSMMAGYVSYNSMKPGVRMGFPLSCSRPQKGKGRHGRPIKNLKCQYDFLPSYHTYSKACVRIKIKFCGQMRQTYPKKMPRAIHSVCDDHVDVDFMFPEFRT